jgi:hypothetical protein
MLYQETLVGGMDLAHDALKLLRHSLGIEHAPGKILLLLCPLGRVGPDLLQLAECDELPPGMNNSQTHEMWSDMRDLSSGEIEAGNVGLDGASKSAVFSTTSTTSLMPSSLSSTV